MTLKILFVIPNLFHGGAEYQLYELCKSLQRDSEHTVRVLSFYSERSRDLDGHYRAIRELGVELDTLFDRMVTGPALLAATRRYLKTHPADVVQTFLQANQYALPASLGLGHRLYLGIRNMIDLPPAQLWLAKRLDSRVTAYVGNARHATEHYVRRIGCSHAKGRTIYNGIDLRRLETGRNRQATRLELGLPDDVRCLITVSNLHFPHKGHRELIEAWIRLAPDRPKDVLLLAGTGSLIDELRARAVAAGLGERTRFLGLRTDVFDLLRASDLYVSPSWTEGFSNSIAEAVLCGLPIVATRVGGSPEIVEEGPSGTLVAPRNVAALAEAMSRDYLPQSRTRLESFKRMVDLERLGQDYLKLYSEVETP